MVEANTDEDLERGAITESSPASGGGRGGAGVPLADEGADELPALLAIAVGIAILVIGLIWPTIQSDSETTASDTEVAAADEPEDADAADGEADAPAQPAGPDVAAIQAMVNGEAPEIIVENDGNTIFLIGEVPDEGIRQSLIDLAQSQPNVDAVNAEGLVIAQPAPTGTGVEINAGLTMIVLNGSVPDEATREAIVAKAAEPYMEDQIVDNLVIDPAAQPPITITITGSTTNQVLYDQVLEAFVGIEGVELGDTSGFVREESNELEAALNGLEPIQFDSGSAIITQESLAIIDQAAELLNANPDVAIEVRGHTDSLGGDESNQQLSEDRAQSVIQALQDRSVTNELRGVGFGERSLKVSPDENDPEAQAENRRIEFWIVG